MGINHVKKTIQKQGVLNMDLTIVEVLQGIFTLVFSLISIYIAFKMIVKYLQFQKRNFIFLAYHGFLCHPHIFQIRLVLLLIPGLDFFLMMYGIFF